MKKITESQLIERARGLRSYLSDATLTTADGTPVASGSGAPVQTGKPAPAAAPAPGANPWEGKDPAKAAAWAKLSPMVQKKIGMADPTDNIIVGRMAQGEFGGLFGGGASDANPDGSAKAATIPAKANAAADQATVADIAQLQTLIGQLKTMSAGQGAKVPGGDKRTPAEIQASADLNKAGLEESTTYFLNKLRLMEAAPVAPAAAPAAAPAPAPAAGGDKAAIVKQIQDIMARINSNNENPSPEIAKALGDAQAAIDTASAPVAPTPDQGAKVPPKAWAKGTLGMGSKGPEVNALQKQLGIPETGVFDAATKAAVIKKQTELKVKPDGAWGATSQAAMAAAPKLAAAPPADNRSGYEKVMPNFLGGKSAPAPAAAPAPTKESVSYSDEDSLARIISLSRRN